MAPFRPGAAAFRPTPAQIVAAVTSLYGDGIRPLGRILLRRLGEIAAAAAAAGGDRPAEPEAVPYIDAKRLRRLCVACRALRVEPGEAGEYSVLVEGLPAAFVDSSDPRDPFPAELWSAAGAYFRGPGGGAGMLLPAGCYACARELRDRALPFLSGYSLGEVCHVVRLAITRRRVLGYRGNHLVPFHHSETWMKEQCAIWQQPSWTARQAPTRTATWHEALACLQEILASAAGGGLPMSNVKRRFRSDYHLDLNETQLGYTRLLDLLRGPTFQSVCRVEANGHGYVVVQHAGCGPPQTCAVLSWSGCCGSSCTGAASSGGLAPPHDAVSVPPPMAAALPSRALLVPVPGVWAQAGVSPDAGAGLCGGGPPASSSDSSWGHSSSSDGSEISARLFDDASASSARLFDDVSASSPASRGGRPRRDRRADPAPHLDAEGESAHICGPATPMPSSLRDAVQSSLCSHLEARGGSCCVRNTFINIVTPGHCVGSRERAQSVPKDFGSSRATWAAVRDSLLAASPEDHGPDRAAWAAVRDSLVTAA